MAVPEKPIRTIQTVIHRVSDSYGIRKLVLKQPDNWDLPRFRPGAHIDFHLSEGQIRSYSLCGNPDSSSEYMVAVKKSADSHGASTYIHESLKQGDIVDVSLPRCTFPLTEPSEHQIFIAGGIGITPFISMAHELDATHRPYELHVFFRRHVPLACELRNIGKAGQIILHDRQDEQDDMLLARLFDKPIARAHAYCCGPPRMMSQFRKATADWAAGTVHEEHFVAPVLVPLSNSYALVLKKSGLILSVPSRGNALQVIHKAGVALDSSCEGGICGACRVTWLEGEPVHRDLCLSDAQRLQYFMPCVGGCSGSRLVIDL